MKTDDQKKIITQLTIYDVRNKEKTFTPLEEKWRKTILTSDRKNINEQTCMWTDAQSQS